MLGLVCVLTGTKPLEVFLRVQKLDLQVQSMRQHDLCELGGHQLPVLEIVSLLRPGLFNAT